MKKLAVFLIVFFSFLTGAYFIGVRDCKIEALENYVESAQNHKKQKDNIYSVPNASREQLLELMRKNKL